jgi:hypothetical protein
VDGGPLHPEHEVAEIGRMTGVVGPVEQALPPSDEDRVGPGGVQATGRFGRRGVPGDPQRQGRQDGEDPLEREGHSRADGQREDDAARRRGPVSGQAVRRLALQPGVLAEVLRRQLEDDGRRVGVGDELGTSRAWLDVTAGRPQLGDEEVLGPEQADVDGITRVRWHINSTLPATS